MSTAWSKSGFFISMKQLFFLNGLMIFMLFAFKLSINAQTISATLKADSGQILIGDHLQIKLVVKYANGLTPVLPVLSDTLGNMELLGASKTDTIIGGNFKTMTKTYTVSAYDSGEYHAGPVMIFFRDNNGITDSIISNEEVVLVNTLDVDTTKPFKAIKAPLDVPYSWREFIPHIIAGVILLIAIISGIIFWKKYRKQKPVVMERPKPKDPPHIWARKELQQLESEKLWQKDEVKQYYSRMTDILRLYLEYRYDWLALESTTEEIEANIDRYQIKHKAKDSLLSILRSADLVKFAKMLPMPDANLKAMEDAYKFIEFTEPRELKSEDNRHV